MMSLVVYLFFIIVITIVDTVDNSHRTVMPSE